MSKASNYSGNYVFDSPQDWRNAFGGDGKSVIVDGEERHFSAMPKPEGHDTRSYSRPFKDRFKTIPRSDWGAALKEQEAKQRRSSDMIDFDPLDQDGNSSCWAAGAVHAAMMTRSIMGLPDVELSICSVAGPVTGGSNRGGYEGESTKELTEVGADEAQFWPTNSYNMNHFTDESKARMQNFRLLESLEMESVDDWVTACLQNLVGPFSYGWMGHVMCACDIVQIEAGDDLSCFGFRPRNSWGQWGQKNSKGKMGWAVYRFPHGIPDSGFIFYQMTAYKCRAVA